MGITIFIEVFRRPKRCTRRSIIDRKFYTL